MGSAGAQGEKHPDLGTHSSVPESMPNLAEVSDAMGVDVEGSAVSDDDFEKKQNYNETEGQGKRERGGNRKFESRTREHW